MIWDTFSVYIAILKEIGVNLAIFTPQKGVFPLLDLKIDHLKNQAIPSPGKNLELYPPADSDLAHHWTISVTKV